MHDLTTNRNSAPKMERATTPGASSGAVTAAPAGAAAPTLPVEHSKWQDFTAAVQGFATKQMKQVREICAPNAPCLGTTWPGHNCAIHSPPFHLSHGRS